MCNCPGLSANLKGSATPAKPNGWSPLPIPRRPWSHSLEARSVGVPCIATTDGGVKETAGPHALFCKPGDIDSLFECMKKAIQMEDNQYQEHPSWPKSILNNMFVRLMSMQGVSPT